MQNLIRIFIATLCLIVLLPQAQAASKGKPKAAQQVRKERLILLPMDISEENRAMYGQLESAVVQGLAQKYEVFSGERVMQELRKAAGKENSRANKNCDETRCLEDVAIALQSENVAMVHATKTNGGYLLSISIKNVMTNQAVFDNSLPCKSCDVFQVIDRLKELTGNSPVAAAPVVAAAEAPQPKINQNDPDAVLWAEAQKGNTADDYQVYLDAYPKGKYVLFAKAKIKKIKEAEQAAADQQEQQAWDVAQQESSEASLNRYLQGYPSGRFVGFAKTRLNKLKTDQAYKEESELWNKADSSNDKTAVEAYLNKYPSGRYIAAASIKLKAIQDEDDAQWNAVHTSEDSKVIQNYLNKYSTGSHHLVEAQQKLAEIRKKEAAQVSAQIGAHGRGASLVKERLVLMPLRVSEDDKGLQGAMETALVEGLQQKYEVLSGEQVDKKVREIFMKESKKAINDTRAMQAIAESFQSELLAAANVNKKNDGYFLTLSIENIFDNKIIFSKSMPCQYCDVYQVLDKLKVLSGVFP